MDLRPCGFCQKGAAIGLGFAAKAISCMTALCQPKNTGHLSSSLPNRPPLSCCNICQAAKYLTCVTSAVFTTTVIQLFEDQYMKCMSVIQLSEMRRVTTCCRRPRISWSEMQLQCKVPATKTKWQPMLLKPVLAGKEGGFKMANGHCQPSHLYIFIWNLDTVYCIQWKCKHSTHANMLWTLNKDLILCHQKRS